MYSQGSQCSVSAPKIGHLLIATLLGYDLKMKIIIAFDYSLGRKKKSTNWLCSLHSGVSIIIINIKTFQKQLATRKMRYIVLLMAPFKKIFSLFLRNAMFFSSLSLSVFSAREAFNCGSFVVLLLGFLLSKG